MSEPTVSVIIPAYRAAATIGRALDGVLSQTRPPDEIVVVDDGSPDDLAAAVEPYRGSVALLRKPNGGAASARNLGIDRTRGDLIAFLDSDDYWEPTKLERQVAAFREHPALGLTSCRFFYQEPGRGRTVPFGVVEVPDLRKFGVAPFDRAVSAAGPEVMTIATRVLTSAAVVRREALGDLRFVPGLEPAEDRDLWVRLIASHPVLLDSALLCTMVQSPGSLSRADINKDFANMLRVIGRHGSLLGRAGTRRWERVFYRLWASCLLGEGDARSAVRPAWNRAVRQPCSPEGWWILAKSLVRSRLAAGPGAGGVAGPAPGASRGRPAIKGAS
jgi:glycosyltransferase involved in cell wall biosynthesis